MIIKKYYAKIHVEYDKITPKSLDIFEDREDSISSTKIATDQWW
jgi:hypothetical protein